MPVFELKRQENVTSFTSIGFTLTVDPTVRIDDKTFSTLVTAYLVHQGEVLTGQHFIQNITHDFSTTAYDHGVYQITYDALVSTLIDLPNDEFYKGLMQAASVCVQKRALALKH